MQPQWLNGDDLADNAKAPEFLINDILETDSHGIMSGSSMAFKTFCVLKMAHSICTAADFFGHEVFTTGKVLYICGEGKGALSRRIKALKLEESDFNGNLFVLDQPLGIDDIACMKWLRKSIAAIKPMFVIADTFSSLATSTSENDNTEVARTLRLVSATCRNDKTSSMIIHHHGKDVTKGSRGAYAFTGNVDFSYEMVRAKGSMETKLVCVKMKDGENFKDIYMKAHAIELGLDRQDGKSTTSLVLKPTEGSSGVVCSLTENQIKVLDAVIDCINAFGKPTPEGLMVVNEKEVRQALSSAFRDAPNPYKPFNDYLPALIKKGVIYTKDGIYCGGQFFSDTKIGCSAAIFIS